MTKINPIMYTITYKHKHLILWNVVIINVVF